MSVQTQTYTHAHKYSDPLLFGIKHPTLGECGSFCGTGGSQVHLGVVEVSPEHVKQLMCSLELPDLHGSPPLFIKQNSSAPYKSTFLSEQRKTPPP